MPGSPTAERNLNSVLARVGGISTQQDAQEFVDVVSDILDYDKELEVGSKSRTLTNLRRVCGQYGIVPTSYVLAGVVKNEHVPQKTGIVAETWRGIYETNPVAVKIFKITEGCKDYDKIKAGFYKEAVLWKRLAHKNILPLLGVSRDVAEFCLVSPWMKNGTIVEYVRNNPQVNPLGLLKDVANGLNYLHTSGLVHGDLRAEHILIGDEGQACIANTGHTKISPTGFTISKINIASGTWSLNELRWRWAAPELQRPEEYGMSKVVATKPSDIYGMGMLIYEVLAREVPFCEYADLVVLTEIQNGKRPRRPANGASLGITDSIWMLLGQCWDWDPDYRPKSTHVLNTIRKIHQSGDAGVAIPGQFKLKMEDIVINLATKQKIKPYITLQYGSRVHTTPCATAIGENRYIWNDHESWTITLDRQCRGQVITVQLFRRKFFRRRKLLGTGKLSLGTITMALCAEIDTQLAKGFSGAKVNVQLMYVVTSHRRINTGDDAFEGLCDGHFIGTRLALKPGIKAEPIQVLGRWIGTYGLGPVNLLVLVFTRTHKIHVPPEV